MADHLTLESVYAGYGDTTILEDVSVTLPKGSVCALLGRNGAGKSTLLSTILGRTTFKTGRIIYEGSEVSRVPIHLRARMGMGLVSQEREIFSSLTVEENLFVGARPAVFVNNDVRFLHAARLSL